jgi:signal transduction histidine kinase
MKLLMFHIILITQPLVKIITNERLIQNPSDSTIKFNALENDIRFFVKNEHQNIDSISYQLVGYDQNPITTLFPEIRYTELQGGSYTLNIKKYDEGKIIENTSAKIDVENELTEEWWFWPSLAVYAMLLIGAGFYFYLINSFRQKIKVQVLRNRIASDLHDEVGATLSSIAMSSNLVNRKIGTSYPEIQSMLTQIKTDSEETIHTIRDTVWTINPDNDSFDKLTEKLRAFAYQIFNTKGIELAFSNGLTDKKTPKLLMEQRRNAYLIIREALNNIAKHAEATQAEMSIEKTKEGIKISLKDNGKGFDAAAQTDGNGLKNFEKRAKEGFMDFELNTEIGKGTQITLLIPEL